MFVALVPGAFNRACVAVTKSRTISSWQFAHFSVPINSAPGTPGGATIARLLSSVPQESRAIATTYAPPPHQSSLGR